MLESILVLSIAGLLTGIIFSVPAAGPITILIVSNGLKGKLRFCHRVAYGASISDIIYVFIAVYAFSNLYEYYEPYVPYILAAGSLLLIILGIKTYRTKIDFAHMDDSEIVKDKLRNKGGFRAGLLVSFLNPALFVGWLISSFLIISLVSSFGYNTGGLSAKINHTINGIENDAINQQIESRKEVFESVIGDIDSLKEISSQKEEHSSTVSAFSLSLVFALMVAAGSTLWFYWLGSFIVKRRLSFKAETINKIINALGIILLIGGLYFAWSFFLKILE